MNYDAMLTFHRDHGADLTMATIRVPESEASRFGIVSVDAEYQVTSFVEKPDPPPSNLANMGVYVFNLDVLDRVLWEDHLNPTSTHDFGKDILPKMVTQGDRIIAYPYTGYWVDVGTVETYWQAHMDLLAPKPSIDLGDRSWVIHTRTEERPPVRIEKGAVILDSMITDGCVIPFGATIERSILAPGVCVHSEAVIRESIILTDTEIKAGAVIERAIIDKRVSIGEKAHIGGILEGSDVVITMVGKNSQVAPGLIVEPGAVIGTDVIPGDYPSNVVRKNDYIQTKRMPYEI
jgi:glucose-1-phosphate adenylyltransferase